MGGASTTATPLTLRAAVRGSEAGVGSARVRPMTRTAVVIGAGISGLSAAYYLSVGGLAVTVMDKAPVIGGHLRVSDVAGLPVDEGAESLLNRRPEAVELAHAVGLGEDIVYPAPVSAGLWTRGAVVRLPAGTVMGVPGEPDALGDVLTADEIRRVQADASMPGMPVTGDVSVGRFVSERMGRAVVERLVEPLLAGVYAGHADALSLAAAVPQLAAAARSESSLLEAVRAVQRTPVGPARSEKAPVFAGIRGGVGRLPAAVAQASGADVRTGVTVRAIGPAQSSRGGFVLETGPAPRPEFIDADAVVVAVPPAPAARLLAKLAPAAAGELAQVEQASVAIVTVAIPRSAFPRVPESSGFLVPPVEGRTVKAVTLSSVKWPWLGELAGDLVVARASVGRHGETAELRRTDEDLVENVMADLHESLGVSGGPVDARVTRWGGALPQYAVGHSERMAKAEADVGSIPGLAVCGATYAGVGIAACVAGGRRAAASVLADLGAGT
jgi:protoporphyrinogen/coproporphyrinogen III oxidase